MHDMAPLASANYDGLSNADLLRTLKAICLRAH
jgi:hypothetical protein